jgi:hypothetical protein
LKMIGPPHYSGLACRGEFDYEQSQFLAPERRSRI